MTDEKAGRRGPTLKQGCLLSFGGVALAFGACLAAANLQSEAFLGISLGTGLLAAFVGFVLLIVRMVMAITRK